MIRPAATLCALRTGPSGTEVLMVRRSESSSFVGGGYVFPGGGIEDVDRSGGAAEVVVGAPSDEMRPWMAAALRETFEETGLLLTREMPTSAQAQMVGGRRGHRFYEALGRAGLELDAARLAYVSNWLGPRAAPRRFDTRFFVTEVPRDANPRPDGVEVTETVWVTPTVALERAEEGSWSMIVPTRKHLELLSRFTTPAAAVRYARRTPPAQRVEPRVVVLPDGAYDVLLPGDPGYDQAV
jgi:8-oxo-dGTP pyrophosphatase MutT (NUDIX family)